MRLQGIKVAVVQPGNIDTPIWDTIQPPLKAKYEKLNVVQKNIYAELFRGLLSIASNIYVLIATTVFKFKGQIPLFLYAE